MIDIHLKNLNMKYVDAVMIVDNKNKIVYSVRFNPRFDKDGCEDEFESIINRNFLEVYSSILVYGETGTGKELYVQSIHNYSSRRHKPFIAQNCAALPENLFESILFGSVKGAFTGAVDKPGL